MLIGEAAFPQNHSHFTVSTAGRFTPINGTTAHQHHYYVFLHSVYYFTCETV